LRRVDEKVKHRPPRDVYESMVREDSVNAPRDLQQVQYCCMTKSVMFAFSKLIDRFATLKTSVV